MEFSSIRKVLIRFDSFHTKRIKLSKRLELLRLLLSEVLHKSLAGQIYINCLVALWGEGSLGCKILQNHNPQLKVHLGCFLPSIVSLPVAGVVMLFTSGGARLPGRWAVTLRTSDNPTLWMSWLCSNFVDFNKHSCICKVQNEISIL